jgi:hypothetical protein
MKSCHSERSEEPFFDLLIRCIVSLSMTNKVITNLPDAGRLDFESNYLRRINFRLKRSEMTKN